MLALHYGYTLYSNCDDRVHAKAHCALPTQKVGDHQGCICYFGVHFCESQVITASVKRTQIVFHLHMVTTPENQLPRGIL